ncbi:hypothetical protein L195_g063741, partial [Trifolium pratense]
RGCHGAQIFRRGLKASPRSSYVAVDGGDLAIQRVVFQLQVDGGRHSKQLR